MSISTALWVISILTTVVGFFVVRYITRQDQRNDRQDQRNEKYDKTMSNLNKSITELSGTMKNFGKNYENLQERVGDHDVAIIDIDKRLTLNEQALKLHLKDHEED